MLAQFINFIFPKFCLFCDTEGDYICAHCIQSKFKPYKIQTCHICKKPLNTSTIHSECNRNTNIHNVIVCLHYCINAKRVIEEIKYSLNYQIAESVAKIMMTKFEQHNYHESDNLLVVPVPLHYKKMWSRGFNQAELFIKYMKLPYKNVLVRKKYTKTQVGLSKKERKKNVAEVFEVKEKLSADVLLIDDVMTTGSTLEECAKALKSAGAKNVSALVWARD
jgi:competence protein ComFC